MTAYYFGGAYEVTGSDVKKYYNFGGQSILRENDGSLKYMLTDHLGSVVAVTDNTGTLITQQRYLPFGGVRTDTGSITQTNFGYTGQRSLDSGMGGLMDYKARMFSPMLGRFLQPDSLIPDAGNPQAWNRFSYVRNRPVNFNDPSGHRPCGDDYAVDCDGFKNHLGGSTGGTPSPVDDPNDEVVEDIPPGPANHSYDIISQDDVYLSTNPGESWEVDGKSWLEYLLLPGIIDQYLSTNTAWYPRLKFKSWLGDYPHASSVLAYYHVAEGIRTTDARGIWVERLTIYNALENEALNVTVNLELYVGNDTFLGENQASYQIPARSSLDVLSGFIPSDVTEMVIDIQLRSNRYHGEMQHTITP